MTLLNFSKLPRNTSLNTHPSSRFPSPQIHLQASIYARRAPLWSSISLPVHMHTYPNHLVWKQALPRVAIKARRRRWVSHVICKSKKKTSADKSQGRPDRVQAEGEGRNWAGRLGPFISTFCTYGVHNNITHSCNWALSLLEDGRMCMRCHVPIRTSVHSAFPIPLQLPPGVVRGRGRFWPTLPLEKRKSCAPLFSAVQAFPPLLCRRLGSCSARRLGAAVAVRVMRNLP